MAMCEKGLEMSDFKKPDTYDPAIQVTGRVRTDKDGGEQIVFTVPLSSTYIKPTDPQIKITGQLKPGKDGGELIVFSIPLGPIELVCIAPIPDEGSNEFPVYVKIKTKTFNF